MTGFDAHLDDLARRAGEVDHVGDAVQHALTEATAAGSPDAFGSLCAFLPELLAPARQQGHDALAHGADAVHALGDAVRASAEHYGRDDAATAASLRPRGP